MTQTPDQAPDRDPSTPDLDPARTTPDVDPARTGPDVEPDCVDPDVEPDRVDPDVDPARTGPDPALAGAGLSATSTTASDMSPGDDAPGTAYGAPAGTGAEDVETTGTADPAP